MDIRKFFRLKQKEKKEEPWEDRLHKARMEVIRKDIASSDEIIGMMKSMSLERRCHDLAFEGPERRNGQR